MSFPECVANIVGVWGWTCVRVVFVVSSWCRRGLVVVSSWCRRGVVVNSLPCGRASGGVLEDFLLRVKFEGSLARNARFGASKSQDGRSFWRFAWQAQCSGSVSMQACRFLVAGAALGNVAFCICVAGAAFCGVSKGAFSMNRSVRAAQTWHSGKSRGRRSIWWLPWKVAEASQKVILLELCENRFIRKNSHKIVDS